MTRVSILARPDSTRDAVEWDAWRGRWVVSCRAPAIDGMANDALLSVVAARLGVRRDQVRLVLGARTRRKTLEVDGLTADDVERRLNAVSGSERMPRRRAGA
ncbi:MAG TPA: DUF167 domain-containing protein [Thermoplasmata archaeon]|nr:DUF167 domain-containing protein [Thermoplasmata archaeon]